jgi:hypothetical protein
VRRLGQHINLVMPPGIFPAVRTKNKHTLGC